MSDAKGSLGRGAVGRRRAPARGPSEAIARFISRRSTAWTWGLFALFLLLAWLFFDLQNRAWQAQIAALDATIAQVQSRIDEGSGEWQVMIGATFVQLGERTTDQGVAVRPVAIWAETPALCRHGMDRLLQRSTLMRTSDGDHRMDYQFQSHLVGKVMVNEKDELCRRANGAAQTYYVRAPT